MAQQMLLEGRPKRKRMRTSYSLATKLQAVEEAQRGGPRMAAVLLGIDERTVRQWLTQSHAIRMAGLTNDPNAKRMRPNRSIEDDFEASLYFHLIHSFK